jgi:dolichyl-phosphate-mannose-protein mannosyltransferase/PA14 domain-containing protein
VHDASAVRSGPVIGATLAAIALALVAQHLTAHSPYGATGWALFALAAAIMAAAGRGVVWDRTCPTAPSRTTVGMLARIASGVAAGVAAVGATVVSAIDRWPLLALLLWVLGFALATLAMRGWIITAPRRADVPWARRETVALVAVGLLAAVLRTIWLDALPRYYFGDESRVGAFLRETYDAGIPNPFTMGWNTWPLVGLSLQGVFAPLLGLRTATLRLSSALMGTLAVPVTYALARRLYRPRVALCAAVLLAICRTAIDFSRLGTCHAQVMLIEPLAFYWWWRAVDSGRASSYLWAGIGLGLCLFTYNAGQSAPVLWLGWLLLAGVCGPRMVRAYGTGVAVVLVGFLLATLPYLFCVTDHGLFADNWGQFTVMARNRQSLGQAVELWHTRGLAEAANFLGRQTSLTWLGFTVLPAGAYGMGYRGGGMLDHVTAALFILGLAISLPQLHRGRAAFVPYWWIFTTVVGGVLTLDPPAVVRLVGVLPALAILAALPLDALVAAFEGRRSARVGIVLTAALIAAATWDNWRTYFVEFAAAPVDDTSELARRVQQLPPEVPVFLIGSEHFLHFRGGVNLELFPFEFPGRRLVDVPEPAHTFPLRERFATTPVIVLSPSQASLVGYIRSLYPNTRVTDVTWPNGRLLFRMLEIQPTDVDRHAGLEMHAYGDNDQLLEHRVTDPFDGALVPPATCRRLTWTGSVYWPTGETAFLTLSSAEPVQIRLANQTLEHEQPGVSQFRVREALGWVPLTLAFASCRPTNLTLAVTDPTITRFLTRWDLRPTAIREGLTARYERQGQPLLQATDPQINALAVEELFPSGEPAPLVNMPFSVTWKGVLHVPDTGRYEFKVEASGPYSVRLDGERLFQETVVNPENPTSSRAARELGAGDHALLAQWDSTPQAHTSRRIFQLFWKPPSDDWELIPPSAFSPE